MATERNEIVFTVTHAGKNAALNAEMVGLLLKLNIVGFGIGHGDSNQNSENLVNKILETELSAGGVQPTTNTLMLGINYTPPQDLYLSEIGIYTEDGVLFAIAQKTEGHFFIFSEGIPFIGSFGLNLGDLDANKIEITVMQDATIAQQMIFAHEAHPDPHPQYVLKEGILPYLNSLAKVIWHVGSWHGSDDPNYDPSTALEPIFGYKTNWELKPYIPYGVTNLSDAILREYKVQDGGSLIAHTTRLWKRLHDDFNCVITVDNIMLFEKDKVTFTLTSDSVPDNTMVAYEIVGKDIQPKDFRELQKADSLQGHITFINNEAKLTLTRNHLEYSNGTWLAGPSYVDARDFKLKLIGVESESVKISLPIVYAGLSELVFSSNGDGSGVNTYFVIATRGIPVGTKGVISQSLHQNQDETTFEIDQTGRFIFPISKSGIDFTLNDGSFKETVQFGVSLKMLGKTWSDNGMVYRIANNHTEMRFAEPMMSLSKNSLEGGFIQIMNESESMRFAERGISALSTSSTDHSSVTILNGLNYVTGVREGNKLTAHKKQNAGVDKSGQFGVIAVGTDNGKFVTENTEWKPYARILFYVD